MKSIGTITSSLAYRQNISDELSEVIALGIERCSGPSFPDRRLDFGGIIAALSLCDSPIEKIMLASMITMPSVVAPIIHNPMSGEAFPLSPLVITPQFVFSRYRLDFLVTIQRQRGPFSFAVECDGIQFHGAFSARQSDKDRDAYLQALGIKTIRYYGQKIKKLGHQCADEIASIVNEELARA